MADPVTIRRLEDDDAQSIVALYERAASVERGLGPVPLADWLRFTKLPQNNGCRDFRVAEHQDQVIGLAESTLKDQGDREARFFKLVVDPRFRRQGVATVLLAELLAIEGTTTDLSLQTLVSREWSSGVAFVAALGFEHLESEITMRCTHLAGLERVGRAKDATFERVGDVAGFASEIARIHNEAYESDASFRRVSAEEIRLALDDEELWIVQAGGRVVGFCHLQAEAGLVWLESLAVEPASQGLGLGAELVLRALGSSRVSHDRPALLNVSSKNASALALYRRLGFLARHEKLRFSASRSRLLAHLAQRGNQGH
jgi:mycothiol synthase